MTSRVLAAAAASTVALSAIADIDSTVLPPVENFWLDIDNVGGTNTLIDGFLAYDQFTPTAATFTITPGATDGAGCPLLDSGDLQGFVQGDPADATRADWVPSNFAAEGAGSGLLQSIIAIPVDCDNDGIQDEAIDGAFNIIPNSRVYNVVAFFVTANPFDTPDILPPVNGTQAEVLFPAGIPTADSTGTDFHSFVFLNIGTTAVDGGVEGPRIQFDDFAGYTVIAQEGDAVGTGDSFVSGAESFGSLWVDPAAPSVVPEPTDWEGGSGWAYPFGVAILGDNTGLALAGQLWAGVPGAVDDWSGDLGFMRPYRAIIDVAVGVVEDTTVNPCPQDINGDTVLDVFDILAFFDLFGVGDLAADFDPNGILDIFDILAFFDLFSQPCPGSFKAPQQIRLGALNDGPQMPVRMDNR